MKQLEEKNLKKNGPRIWTEVMKNAIKEKHKAYFNILHNTRR